MATPDLRNASTMLNPVKYTAGESDRVRRYFVWCWDTSLQDTFDGRVLTRGCHRSSKLKNHANSVAHDFVGAQGMNRLNVHFTLCYNDDDSELNVICMQHTIFLLKSSHIKKGLPYIN